MNGISARIKATKYLYTCGWDCWLDCWESWADCCCGGDVFPHCCGVGWFVEPHVTPLALLPPSIFFIKISSER